MNEHDFVSIITDGDKDTFIKRYRKFHINKNYKKIYDHLIAEKIIFDSDLDDYFRKLLLSSEQSKLVLDEENYYLNFLNIKFPRTADGYIKYEYVLIIVRLLTKLMSIGYSVKYNYGFEKFNVYNTPISIINIQNTPNTLNTYNKNKDSKDGKGCKDSKDSNEINRTLLIIESVEIIPYFEYDTQCDFVFNALNTPIILNFDSRPNTID